MSNKVAIRQLATGVPGLDAILGGGLPEFSFNLIAGPPGSGKTTLAHQIMFSLATRERPALFFSVLGEPPVKMLRYQQQFSFFDLDKVDDSIRFINLSDEVASGNFDQVLARIAKEVEVSSAALVFVDSFRSVMLEAKHQLRDTISPQQFVQQLGIQLSSWQATTFLVGEYFSEADTHPIFTVADGLLSLCQSVYRNSMVRKLQVLKMRGQATSPGVHTFRITGDGIEVFPAADIRGDTGTEVAVSSAPRSNMRLQMGVPYLDEMLGGGLPSGYSLLVAGPSGSGKTILATAFLAEGVRLGEPGIMVAFEQTPSQSLSRTISDLARAGQIGLINTRAVDLSIDEIVKQLGSLIQEMKATRVVIDSLSGFELAVAPTFREDFRESLFRMVSVLSGLGVTVLVTSELEDRYSDLRFSPYGSAFLTDAIIVQRYIELESRLKRVMAVVKVRASSHSNEIRQYEMSDSGIVIGDPVFGFEGLLGGGRRGRERPARAIEPHEMSIERLRSQEYVAVKILAEREAAVLARERAADLREGAERARADLSGLTAAQLREANERLVVATVRAQTMTEAAEMATARMSHMAAHDYLTGLPNRSLLSDRLALLIALAQRHGRRVALMYLDLDHFKHINDSLGHAIGDQLLQSAARRLQGSVRQSDTVCRQGGDEFVMLLADVEHVRDAALTAEKLIEAMAEPYLIGGHRLQVTLSIGVSFYPDDANDVEGMLRNADTAMYYAKKSGRNNYQVFTAEMNVRAVARQAVEKELRHALDQREFVLHYQPKVNLETGAITGAETLLRLQQSDHRLLYPMQFVSIAEDCGLILPIGKWVLREACRQTAAWLQAGLDIGRVAVNVSAVEFHAKDFLADVRAILDDTGLDPSHLEIEMTEGGLMQDAEPSTAILHALKKLGVQLTVDDFGTGYSSLSYLRRFPIDTLKIDQSFVQDIHVQTDEATLVSAIIAMGKSLKLRVVAEGIETPQQLAFLRSQRCAEGQGYYFSRPVVAGEFAALLANSRHQTAS